MSLGEGEWVVTDLGGRRIVAGLVAALMGAGGVASVADATTSKPAGCTVIGTAGPDRLVGTPSRDVICGMGGDDVLRGRGGRDVLRGGGGADVLTGGAGADALQGGVGDDLLQGGPGVDRYACGAGFDTYRDGAATIPGATCEDRSGDQGPVAYDDAATATEDTALELEIEALLVNDADPERQPLSLVDVSDASGGAISLDGTSLRFTPAPNACGEAGFDYLVSDGRSTDKGHVAVTVDCVNDAPAGGADVLVLTEDTATTVPVADLLANDSDTEDDPLTVGTLGQGYDFYELSGDEIVFHPPADVCGDSGPRGDEDFAYTLSDGVSIDLVHVDVDIRCVNDAPMAVDDFYFVEHDAPGVISTDYLLSNDVDVDWGDEPSLFVSAVGNPTNGSVHLSDQLTFTPAAGFCGVAEFDYTVSDGTATDTGHVRVAVGCPLGVAAMKVATDAPWAEIAADSGDLSAASPVTTTRMPR